MQSTTYHNHMSMGQETSADVTFSVPKRLEKSCVPSAKCELLWFQNRDVAVITAQIPKDVFDLGAHVLATPNVGGLMSLHHL